VNAAAAVTQQRAMLAGVQSDSEVSVDDGDVPVWMTVGWMAFRHPDRN